MARSHKGSQRKLGVGLIGYGYGGRVFHAPVIAGVRGLELRAIVERSTQLGSRNFPSVRIFRCYEELIAQSNIDLVVVSTPNPTHFEIATLVLESGKHVVVDKPMAVSSEQAAALEAKALEKQLILSPYHNRRWDGDFKTVARLLEKGALGNPILYESYFDRYRPQLRPGAWRERPEPGSGFLFDLGSHLFDQAFSLFGLPRQLFAEIRRERPGALVDDAFDVSLIYDGLSVRIGASALRTCPRPRFFVQGSAVSFMKYGYDLQPDLLEQGKRPRDSNWAREPEKNWGDLQDFSKRSARKIKTEPGDYRAYYENIRDAIAGKTRLQVTAADGRNTIKAIELAMQSSLLKSSVPWDKPAKSASADPLEVVINWGKLAPACLILFAIVLLNTLYPHKRFLPRALDTLSSSTGRVGADGSFEGSFPSQARAPRGPRA